jgi:hypothetical protein
MATQFIVTLVGRRHLDTIERCDGVKQTTGGEDGKRLSAT